MLSQNTPAAFSNVGRYENTGGLMCLCVHAYVCMHVCTYVHACMCVYYNTQIKHMKLNYEKECLYHIKHEKF